MQRPYFTDLEEQLDDTQLSLDTFISKLAFDEQGLIPIITQDKDSLQVLMFAWVSEKSLRQTLAIPCEIIVFYFEAQPERGIVVVKSYTLAI